MFDEAPATSSLEKRQFFALLPLKAARLHETEAKWMVPAFHLKIGRSHGDAEFRKQTFRG